MRGLTAKEARLLFKLYRHEVFGAHHLLEDNVLRGFPSDELGEFRAALEGLKRDGILVPKSTRHGQAVYIPPTLSNELYVELKKYYPFLPRRRH